jgi:hypothetical protein
LEEAEAVPSAVAVASASKLKLLRSWFDYYKYKASN